MFHKIAIHNISAAYWPLVSTFSIGIKIATHSLNHTKIRVKYAIVRMGSRDKTKFIFVRKTVFDNADTLHKVDPHFLVVPIMSALEIFHLL